MALCSSCHNIVPRSITRCPVCGAAPAPESTVDHSLWQSDDSMRQSDAVAHGSQMDPPVPGAGISPEDFVAELAAPTRWAAPDGSAARIAAAEAHPTVHGESYQFPPGPEHVHPALESRVPTPLAPVSVPTAGPASGDAPGWIDPDTQPRFGPAPSLDPLLASPLSALPVELDPDEERIRSVQAISSRINVDIRMSRLPHHRVLVTAVPAIAALIVAAVAVMAYRNPPVDSASPGAFGTNVTLAYADGDEIDVQARTSTAAPSLLPLTVAGCGPVTLHTAVLVAPSRVITRASFVLYDVNPTITLPDGTVRIGTVIGVDQVLDLAVVELDAPATIIAADGAEQPLPSISWGPVDQLFYEPRVIVVQGQGDQAAGTIALQDGIDGIVGKVRAFDLDQGGFAAGSAVLNQRGMFVGLIDASGARATGGAELQSSLGRLSAARTMATAACPAPVPEDPAAGEG